MTRGNGLKLHKERFRLDIRKGFHRKSCKGSLGNGRATIPASEGRA